MSPSSHRAPAHSKAPNRRLLSSGSVVSWQTGRRLPHNYTREGFRHLRDRLIALGSVLCGRSTHDQSILLTHARVALSDRRDAGHHVLQELAQHEHVRPWIGRRRILLLL